MKQGLSVNLERVSNGYILQWNTVDGINYLDGREVYENLADAIDRAELLFLHGPGLPDDEGELDPDMIPLDGDLHDVE